MKLNDQLRREGHYEPQWKEKDLHAAQLDLLLYMDQDRKAHFHVLRPDTLDADVQQAVENYFDVQNAKWSGSGSFTIMAGDAFNASETFYLTQDESSADIFILSNQNIRIAKAGTYRFSGGIRSGNFHGGRYTTVRIKLSTGQQIGTASMGDTSYLHGDVLSSVTFSGPATFSVIADPNGGIFNTTSSNVAVNFSNFAIQRIA